MADSFMAAFTFSAGGCEMKFDAVKFADATMKLHRKHSDTDRFHQEFAHLVFRYFGPPGLYFEEVSLRVRTIAHHVTAEMFALGGGLVTVTVNTNMKVDIDIDK